MTPEHLEMLLRQTRWQPFSHIGQRLTSACHGPMLFFFILLIYQVIIRPKYHFSCDLALELFMDWTDGQVHQINYG